MTAELRQRLRLAIDAHRRHLREAQIESGELTVCSACGCYILEYVDGCERCTDRRRKRERYRRVEVSA